ncbi:MAG TPA: FecR family protein [Candidatus Binataceae bacterium]|nr:FecR family protein [Candidatus Binataceae bacterium]
MSTVLFTLTLILMSSSPVTAQRPIGTVTRIDGVAMLERGGRSLKVGPGTAVAIGDKLVASANGRLTVTLDDGDQLILAESTSIVIQGSAGIGGNLATPIQLVGGHLRSLVDAGLRGLSRPFEVHTPNAITAVRGTDFETAYIEGKPCPGFPDCLRYTDVGVYKGVVEVTNPADLKASVRVTEGYETTVPCELAPSSPAPLGIGDLMGPGYR